MFQKVITDQDGFFAQHKIFLFYYIYMKTLFTYNNFVSVLLLLLLTYIVIYLMYPELFNRKKEYFQNKQQKQAMALALGKYMESINN